MAQIKLTVVSDIAKAKADIAALGEELKALQPKSITTRADVTQVYNLQKQYANLVTSLKNIKTMYPEGTFDALTASVNRELAATKALNVEVGQNQKLTKEQTQSLQTLQTKYANLSAQIATTKAETDKHTTAVIKNGDSIASMAKKFIIWQTAATLVMQPLQWIRNALQSINETLVETEDAVISIQRVLDENITTGAISDEIYRIAQELGQTFDVVQEIAQNFAKAGLDWQETIQATESAVLALNVAELTAAESSEGLIAIMQQFGYEASQLTYVIDVLNKAADKSAVDTQDLLVALQKTGSYAKTANLSLEETVALITAISEATAASGQNIGNALKSLFAYTTKDSALDVFAALSTDSAAVVAEYRKGAASILDVWKQVSTELNNLTAEQGNLLDQYFASEEGSALEQELSGDLSEIYDSIKGIYDTAGVYRKNYFLALLGNMDEVENVLDVVSDAAGYTMEEQEKYMDTYTAKLNALQSQWESLVNDEQGILGLKKALVDAGSGILTIIEWTGGLRTTFIALATVIAAAFGGKALTSLINYGKEIKGLINPLKNFKAAVDAARYAQDMQRVATELQTTADQKAAIAQQLKNSGSASAAAIEAAETAAINAQTLATRANTAATQASAVATKSLGTAFSTALGVIGIVATAISAVVGAIQQYNEEVRQARIESVNAWKETKDQAEELQELYDKYNQLKGIQEKTTEQENEYLQVQEDLLDLFGDKKKALEDLKVGTDEYREAIENLTEAKLNLYHQDLITAQESAEDLLEDQDFPMLKVDGATSDIGGIHYSNPEVVNALKEAGLDTKFIGTVATPGGQAGNVYLGGIVSGNTVEAALHNQAVYLKAQEALYDAYNEYIRKGDFEAAEAISSSEFWTTLADKISESESLIDDYFETTVPKLLIEYERAFGEVKNATEHEQMTQWVIDQIGVDEYWDDTIRELIGSFNDLDDSIDDTGDSADDFSGKIEDLKDKTDELIDALEEARDLTDEAAKLDEKRLAIQEAQADVIDAQNDLLKAQQALENAKNSRTVRRLNSRTGEFEWVADEDKIAEAEEEVQDALDNLAKAQEDVADAIKDYNDYIRDQAFDAVIDELESGNATNDSILAIIEEWAAKAYGTEAPAWVDEIINVLKEFGVDLYEQGKEDGKEESESGGDSGSSKPTKRWTSWQDAANDGFANIATKSEWEARKAAGHSEMSKYASYQDYLDAMNAQYGGYGADWSAAASTGIVSGIIQGAVEGGKTVIGGLTDFANGMTMDEVLQKIFAGTSDAQLQKYIDENGLMFETQKGDTVTIPQIERIGAGNTTNSNNNNSNNNVTINGVKVGSDQYQRPFIDVVSQFSQVPRT